MSTSQAAFTKKLRTAIKAKIQEFGVDADDELPDYVMVLAANKKSKSQMKTDLQLFLAKHTDKFVEWLFDAFERIQKSEADSSNEAPAKKSASSDSAMKEADKKKTEHKKVEEKNHVRSPSVEEKKVEEKKHARSPSVEALPSTSRLRSQVVIPERSTINSLRHKDSSRSERTRSSTQKSISRYVEKSRDHERTRRRSRSAERERRRRDSDSKQTERKSEKTTKISDESDEDNKKSTHRSSTKRSFSPKIHYDDEQAKAPTKATVKEHHSEDEILTVNDDKKKEQQTTRFIIRVGNKEICRTVSIDHLDSASKSSPPAKVDYESREDKQRKRHADDPGRAVTKLLKSQNVRLTSNADRFGKENVKRARLQESKFDDDVEPYSPAPLNPQANIEEEKAIDSFLKSFKENPIVQQQQCVQPIPQIQQQVQTVPIYYQPAINKNLFKLGKCKFWPNCNKNEECPYTHPTSVCTRFPNCQYGAQCIFIHPMCKFNAKCSNPRCPYTHNIKSEPYPTIQKKPDLSKYRWIRPDSD